MFVDASALTAMLSDETDARELLARLQRARRRLTSPLALWESSVALARSLGLSLAEAGDAVEEYCGLMDIAVEPVPPQAFPLALDAFERYGKGRHSARLNFGDCFAYACARHHGTPLLYKGGDFALTDIAPA